MNQNKRVAYIFDITTRKSYAGLSVARGFEDAFKSCNHTFQFFDCKKLNYFFWAEEHKKLLNYKPEIIFTSVENIAYLPLDKLNSLHLILWGQFYLPCKFEKQIVSISEKTKQILNKFRDKHHIIIWSQTAAEINEYYFSGYVKELGLQFIPLMHCADKNKLTDPLFNPAYDFLWIGNIKHRIKLYNSFIKPLKQEYQNYLEFTEKNMVKPEEVESSGLYKNACIAPNIHTEAQIKHSILLNERVFTSTILGGFQICDNMLARNYFNDTELAIATKPEELIEMVEYYIKNREKRMEMIKRMQQNILKNHTYHNRIETILKYI